MPGVQPLPEVHAAVVSSVISIIVSGTWNPRVFADIFNIPTHTLLTVFGTDDLAQYNALVILGHHVLHLVLSTIIYEKLPADSVMMATILKHAFSDTVVLETIMVQQGVYAGHTVKGDTSIADAFKVYIALYTRTFGFARCVDLVRDMYQELLCYAHVHIIEWATAHNIVLSNDFHVDDGARGEVSAAATAAFLSAPPPSDCPDMLVDARNSSETAYNRLFSLGSDAIYAAVVQVIISLWPGSSSVIIHQTANAMLSQPVLEVIPHHFQAEAGVDCRLVYMWCAWRAQHFEWESLCNFARSFVEPMLPAVRRTLFPLFLPNSSIPHLNLSGKAKLACQHVLLYITEAYVFNRYQYPTLPRLFQLLDSASNSTMLWDTSDSAHYDLSHATQQLENARERLDQPAVGSQVPSDKCCISVKGFEVPQALEAGGEQEQVMAAYVQNFIKHSQLAGLNADLHCLGATDLQLDGSAILVAHKNDLRNVFGARSAGSVNFLYDEREFTAFDRPFDNEDEAKKQFLQAVAPRVDHAAIKERNLLAYRPYLSSLPGSQLRDPTETIPLQIFGTTVEIRCAPKTRDGYIPDSQCPDVSHFGVEFIGTDYMGVNVNSVVTEDMKASLEGVETRFTNNGKRLQVLYGAEVSDEFIANLNTTVPRIHFVRGSWRRMDAAILQNWAATIMLKKARLYRFTQPASSLSQALSSFLP